VPYIDTTVLLDALAKILQKQDATKLGIGDTTLTNAVQYGYNEIIDRLTRRGFSSGQVDSWDRRVEFNTQISLWWCFACGGVPGNGTDQWVKNFDLRKDLDTVGVFIDGARVWPASGGDEDAGGNIGGGRLGGDELTKPLW
jgi:hypothetical protein